MANSTTSPDSTDAKSRMVTALGLRRKLRSPRRRPPISNSVNVRHSTRFTSPAPPTTGISTATAYSIPPAARVVSSGTQQQQPSTHVDSDPEGHQPPVLRPPKSRTLTVLSSISQSLSRASLSVAARNVSGSSTASTATVASREPSAPEAYPQQAAAAGRRLRSLPRIIRRSSSGISEQATAAHQQQQPANPRLVSTAQPTAYWAGRFMSLHDRFRSELLTPRNMEVMVAAHAALSTLDNQEAREARTMKPSATSAAVMQHAKTKSEEEEGSARADAALLDDDDNRCRRVFLHLESLCLTKEARASLHVFQQAYARRVKRPALLPPGGSMEDRSFISRLMTASGRKFSGSEGRAEVMVVPASGMRAKRLSLA